MRVIIKFLRKINEHTLSSSFGIFPRQHHHGGSSCPPGGYSYIALQKAIRIKSHRDVREMLKRLSVNLPLDLFNNTSLHYAIGSSDPHLVKIVLEFNPDRTLKNIQGETALDLANKWQLWDIAKLLS